jgi:hypothetical protein
MKSLLMGIRYKHVQSVNYHDSHAHGYERSGVHTRLVGFGMIWIGCLDGKLQWATVIGWCNL